MSADVTAAGSRPDASGARPPRVVLFGKPGCHLCDEMRDAARRALAGTSATIHEVDITRDVELYMRLRHDIPVLEIDGREVARHRVDEAELVVRLREGGWLPRDGRPR